MGVHDRYREYRKDQREFFDALITEDWDTYSDPAWDAARRFEVNRLFELVAPRTILDIGCGCGAHDVLMAEQPGVERVVAIDYSAKSIETAEREYSHPNVFRSVVDVFDLPAEKFDLVVSFQVIEHLQNPREFLASCAGRARPGGSVAVFTPNRERLTNRVRRRLGLPLALEDPQHAAEHTVADLVRMGSELGLEPVGSFSYGLSLQVPKVGWNMEFTGYSNGLPRTLERFASRFAVVLTRVG